MIFLIGQSFGKYVNFLSKIFPVGLRGLSTFKGTDQLH